MAEGTTFSTTSRIATIGEDDPERGRKAFRIFLESTLREALGEGVRDDPGFALLVDEVIARMTQDPMLAPAVERAGDTLWQSARPR